MIRGGNIEGILDKRVLKEVNTSAMWKVAELALQCTEGESNGRPTKTEVVIELKEAIGLLKSDSLDRKLLNYPTVSTSAVSMPSPR